MRNALSRIRGGDRLRRRTTNRAKLYVEHNWPVAALAVPWGTRCPCGQTCTEPHLVSDTVSSVDEADKIWAPGHNWDIALITSWFDVVDLGPRYGALLHHRLVTACPTATAPRGRRWHFVVGQGTFPADLVEASGGTIHTGDDAWIAASPTRIEATGRIGWVVEPLLTRWQPYQGIDPVDTVFAGLEPRPTHHPASELRAHLDEVTAQD